MNGFFDYEKSYITKLKNNLCCIGNKINGRFLFVPEECVDVLLYSYKEEIDVYDTRQFFQDSDDLAYYTSILNEIDRIGLINQKGNMGLRFDRVEKVIISVTNNCNFSCKYCCVDSNKNIRYTELSSEKMYRLIDKALMFNPNLVHVSGGEPFMRKDIMDILSYLRSRYKGRIHLATNGVLIDENNVRKLSEIIDSIDISLDGYDEYTVSLERGRGTFDKVCKLISMLKKYGIKKINISLVNSKKTNSYINDFKKLAVSLDVGYIIRDYYKYGSEDASEYIEKDSDIQYYDKDHKYEDFLNFSNNCLAGNKEIFFDYDGKIYLCPLLKDENLCLGTYLDINENFIKKVYDRSFDAFDRLEKIKTVNRKECDGCDFRMFCFKCPSILINIDNTSFIQNCSRVKSLYL